MFFFLIPGWLTISQGKGFFFRPEQVCSFIFFCGCIGGPSRVVKPKMAEIWGRPEQLTDDYDPITAEQIVIIQN